MRLLQAAVAEAVRTGQITAGAPEEYEIALWLREDRLFLLALYGGARLEVRWEYMPMKLHPERSDIGKDWHVVVWKAL